MHCKWDEIRVDSGSKQMRAYSLHKVFNWSEELFGQNSTEKRVFTVWPLPEHWLSVVSALITAGRLSVSSLTITGIYVILFSLADSVLFWRADANKGSARLSSAQAHHTYTALHRGPITTGEAGALPRSLYSIRGTTFASLYSFGVNTGVQLECETKCLSFGTQFYYTLVLNWAYNRNSHRNRAAIIKQWEVFARKLVFPLIGQMFRSSRFALITITIVMSLIYWNHFLPIPVLLDVLFSVSQRTVLSVSWSAFDLSSDDLTEDNKLYELPFDRYIHTMSKILAKS